MANTGKQIEITLEKGSIGLTEIQKSNLRGLGLRKRLQTVRREDTPSVRGMIKKVIHLVSIKRATGQAPVHVKKEFVEIIAGAPSEKSAAKKSAAPKKPAKKASPKKES